MIEFICIFKCSCYNQNINLRGDNLALSFLESCKLFWSSHYNVILKLSFLVWAVLFCFVFPGKVFLLMKEPRKQKLYLQNIPIIEYFING